MTTRNVFVCALFSLVMFQTVAAEIPPPLFTSVLSVEQSQIQTREPIQLTKIADNKQSPETLRSNVIVAENHVVMLAELGATILERTATGLVKRHVLEFDLAKFKVSSEIFATTDSKHLLWFHKDNIIRLSIDANFQASVIVEPRNFSCQVIYRSERSDEFVCNDAAAGKYRALKVTNQGLVTIAELPAGDVFEGRFVYNSEVYYSSKDKLLIRKFTRDIAQLNVVVFKIQNGQFVETDRQSQEVAGRFYSRASVYDADTGRLWLRDDSSRYDPVSNHVLVDIDPEQGSIKSVNITNDNLGLSLSGYYYNPVISGDFFTVSSEVGKYLLQRQGDRFIQVTPTPTNNDSSPVYSYFRNASGKDEIWKNTRLSLEHFEVTGADWQLKETRSAVQRGLHAIDGQSGTTSDDQRFFAFEQDRQVRILTLDKNKQLQLAASFSNERPLNPFLFKFSKFLKIQTGQYLIASPYSYWVLNEDVTGKITVSAERAWPAEVKSVSSNIQIKVKDGLLYLPPSPNLNVGRVHVMQVKNDEVVVITSLNDNVLTPDEIIRIYGIVELNGKLHALMPTLGKTAVLNFKDGQLSVTKTASMPNVEPPYVEGVNRIFRISNHSNDSREVVLMADAADNLQVSYVSDNKVDGHLYQKRFKIGQYISPDKKILQLNDDVTGVWQDISSSSHSDDWATNGVSTLVLSGHLLTFSKDPLQITSVYKLNTAPYMPAQIEPLKFNQGAETEIALQSYIRDDEQQQLIFSGLVGDAFSLTEDGRLKYKGRATGSGNVLLTVDDGGLKADLTLPYQINAAPVLLKPLPVIMANQNAVLQFDLNEYIADPEGSTISFTAQNQQGFALSQSGILSGIVTGLSDVSIPLEVTDKAGAKFKSAVTIKVNAAPVLTGSSSASGKVNQSFALDLNTLITDAEKHRITLSAQGLPAGLSLNGAVISGTPTAAGSATVAVTAIDELGARSQLSLSLQIAPEDKKSGGSVGFGLVALLALLALLGLRRR